MLEDSTASQPLSNKEKRDLDVEISFLEGLTKRDPKYVEALQLLGTITRNATASTTG